MNLRAVLEQPVPDNVHDAEQTFRCRAKRTPITGDGCAASFLFSLVAKDSADQAPCAYCPAGSARADLLTGVEQPHRPMPGAEASGAPPEPPLGSHPRRAPRGIDWEVQALGLVDVSDLARCLDVHPKTVHQAHQRQGVPLAPRHPGGRRNCADPDVRRAYLRDRIDALRATVARLELELEGMAP